MSSVEMRQSSLSIPTYVIGEAEKNPMFYTGRAYQGAKGAMYPYALLDKLTDNRRDVEYRQISLKNRYIDLSVLPEMGGRIFSGQDLTNGYDFIYRQHVIKPALIGIVGAWISGGAEWDLPHHHRASTYMPVDYHLSENADGSRTVWVGETEWRHRMRWTVGITVYPGRSYIETSIALHNRTPLVNSFLCFTNLAVPATPGYQVIFPPDTEFGVQHAKNEFIHWPVARGTYAGNDFSGVDVSYWKNHPNWISIFAWNHDDDFFGGYDHDRDAGIAHVADHHTVPGKKFFTFGNGTPGRMYDKILTETDGPYIELMAGAYSDNQPDYSWIQPGEVKTVKQYWYPLRNLGGLKKANLDAAVNLEVIDGKQARYAINATAEFRDATILLRAGDKTLVQGKGIISPDRPCRGEITLPRGVRDTDLRLSLISRDGRELISYQPRPKPDSAKPAVVIPPPAPKDIATTEETYLAGMRLEQFHSPAAEPEPYYLEVLKRDPGDIRTNIVLGILYYRRGRLADAQEKLQAAIERSTRNYTRARSGEAHYYMGLVLRLQDRFAEAEDSFNRATWDFAFRAAGYYELAELALIRGDLGAALNYVDESLTYNGINNQAKGLRMLILRQLGRFAEAEALARSTMAADPLHMRSRHELCLALQAQKRFDDANRQEQQLLAMMRPETQSHMELASEYARCLLWQDATDILTRFVRVAGDQVDPMVHYTLAHHFRRLGQDAAAVKHYALGAQMPPTLCFPFRLESIEVLRGAMQHNPADARAPYYLGNLLFDHRPEEATKLWERSRQLDDSFSTVHRNLALGYSRVRGDRAGAIASLAKACACDPSDARLLYELDVLLEAEGVCAAERLERLKASHDVVATRDDVLLREISLHVLAGDYDRALELLNSHHFHVWEGGEAAAHDVFANAHLLRGRGHFAAGRFEQALADFTAAMEYPDHFEIGKPHNGGRIPESGYLAGRAYEAMGDAEKARGMYQQATAIDRPGLFLAYYQALAWRKLGDEPRAAKLLESLRTAGDNLVNRKVGVDFFEKFGSQEDDRRQRAQGHYLLALAARGAGDEAQAQQCLQAALELHPNHLGARTMKVAEMRI